MDGDSLARSEAESPKGCEQDANNKRLKREEKIFATENETMDGDSLARSEAESPQGCEQDTNNKTTEKIWGKRLKIRVEY